MFVSVDVETAGPVPATHALLAVGACLVDDPTTGFYVELAPDRSGTDPAALAVSGLDPAELAEHGTVAAQAMAQFADWLETVAAPERRRVLVALNAPFDWMFVADYFHRYLGRNPFGHSALDLKALFMGRTGVPWTSTGYSDMVARYGGRPLTHNALQDARDQAALFRRILEEPVA